MFHETVPLHGPPMMVVLHVPVMVPLLCGTKYWVDRAGFQTFALPAPCQQSHCQLKSRCHRAPVHRYDGGHGTVGFDDAGPEVTVATQPVHEHDDEYP